MRAVKFLIFVLFTAVKAEETCLSVDDNPYVYFATKTSYSFVNTGLPRNDYGIPRCAPQAFWLLARHGARLPEASEINDLRTLEDFKKNVISNYRSGNYRDTSQRMCSSDVNILENWKWNPQLNLTSAGGYTSEGYMTTQRIAQALRQRYPDLFTANPYDYSFELPNGQLWQDTFRAFTEGLFRQMADNVNLPKTYNDTLFKDSDYQRVAESLLSTLNMLKPAISSHITRAYETCPAWIRDVKENNATLTQYEKFKARQDYKDMILNISQRLGFSYSIDLKSVDRMYEMCRYNKAWDIAQISPWCAAFTKEDLKRLEYAEDLKTYYSQGYGSSLNQKVACPLITDMMKFFKDRVQDPDVPKQPRVLIRFTDDPMYLMTVSALGAHRDAAPLTSDRYNTPQSIDRKWTTSTIDPFNANIAAILYRCNDANIENRFKVLFLENEQPMALDDCSVGLCDWNIMKKHYGEVSENCNMKFCNASSAINGYVGLSIALAAFLMGIIGL